MKRIFASTCILAACAFAVAAGANQSTSTATPSQVALQEPPPPEPPPEPMPEPEPLPEPPPEPTPEPEPFPGEEAEAAEETLQGCLQAGDEPGTFKLTEVETEEGDVALRAGIGVDLAEHLGHTIEVNGSWGEALAPGETGVAEAGAVGDEKTFEADAVEMISDTCEGGF